MPSSSTAQPISATIRKMSKRSSAGDVYADRRNRFMKSIGDGCALLFTAPHYLRNRDTEFEFRSDSYFYYLTGFPEQEAAALFMPQSKTPFTLYVRPRDKHKELWNGKRHGIKGAIDKFSADEAYPIEQLKDHLFNYLRKVQKLHYCMGIYKEHDQFVASLLSGYSPNMRGGERPIVAVNNPLLVLNQMRLYKDAHEIALMQEACDIAAKGYSEVLRNIRGMRHEYEIEAQLEYEFRRHGGTCPSFPSIVAGGANATILHYNTNEEPLKKGELVLIDSGCEYRYYASDVTRTVPLSGKFSAPQKQIYELVLQAQLEVIAKIRPGVRYTELNQLSREVTCKGLLKLGILKGSLAEALKSKEMALYYPHPIGHWLGMDVHDVGDYYEADGSSKILQAGMVITVEPGLYFPKEDKAVPPAYRGIGVRIEDNALVTKSGCRILTAAIPKTVAEVEAACARD